MKKVDVNGQEMALCENEEDVGRVLTHYKLLKEALSAKNLSLTPDGRLLSPYLDGCPPHPIDQDALELVKKLPGS